MFVSARFSRHGFSCVARFFVPRPCVSWHADQKINFSRFPTLPAQVRAHAKPLRKSNPNLPGPQKQKAANTRFMDPRHFSSKVLSRAQEKIAQHSPFLRGKRRPGLTRPAHLQPKMLCSLSHVFEEKTKPL